MKRLLCPTDFSKSSNEAVEYAAKICHKSNAKLVLLNVTEMPPMGMDNYITELHLKELNEYADKQLGVLVETINTTFNNEVEIEIKSLLGDPVNEIIDYSTNNNFDMVVMGTKRPTGLEEFLFGSYTSTIFVSKLELPTLTIPEGMHYRDIKKIVYATDYQEGDSHAIEQLVEIARKLDASIDFLHISKKDDEESNRLFEVFREVTTQFTKYDKLSFHNIVGKESMSLINDYVHENPTDMLALLKHKRNYFQELFHNNVTKRLSKVLDIPLMVFHE